MGSEDLHSTLKWGFAGVIAMLAVIVVLLMNENNEPAPSTNPQIEATPSEKWSASLERKCRAIDAKLEAVQAQMDYMEGPQGDRDGDGAIDDQSTYGRLFQVTRPQLERRLRNTCAVDPDLWEYLRSTG
jgi:hypothetical protein